MDHLSASIELSVFRDCAICLCPASAFSSYCMSPRKILSVQDLGELYFASVIDLLLCIRSPAGRNMNMEQKLAKLRTLIDAHSVHCFPSLFAANNYAHVGLLRVAARKLGLSDVLSSLPPADVARVQELFVAGIELDAQFKQTPVVTKNACAGFDLSCVRLCVPELHCLGQSSA